MKKKILFSIIIVSYNTKKEFLETVNSAIQQTFKEKEIIIIDGKSKDGTAKIIKKYKKYFSKVVIEKDDGIFDAMNKGVKIANGEWIFFLNSGAIFNNPYVLLNTSKHTKKAGDIIFGNCIIKNKFFSYKYFGEYFNNKYITMPFHHQSSFSKRELLINNPFDLKYFISADFDFLLKQYLQRKKFKKINIFVSNVTSGGQSDKNRIWSFYDNLKILKKNNFLKNKKIKLINLFLYLLVNNFIRALIPEVLLKYILTKKYKRNVIDTNSLSKMK